jgi:hypothetical protein
VTSENESKLMRGRALLLLRATWLVLVILTLGLYVVAIPARFQQLLTITPTGDNALVMLAPVEAAALAQHGIPVTAYALYFILVETLFTAIFTTLGLAIFLRRSDEWWAAFMSLALIAFGVLVPATPRVLDALGSPWEFLVHVIQNVGWVSFATSFYLFPDGRFVPRVSRLMVVVFVGWALAWILTPLANPFNWQLWQALVPFLALFASGALAQLYRYKFVSTPAQRLQTKWVVFAFAISTVGIVLFLAPQVLWPQTREPGWDRVVYHLIGVPVFASGLLAIPLSLDIAIRRYRLWEIDPIINRALVYGALTVLLVVIYFAGVVGLQQIWRVVTGQGSDLAIILSTLAIAALFNPLRGRVQNVIDRRFYRRKYDGAQVLAAFGVTVRDEVELDELTEHLLAVVEETMQPASVSLWLRATDDRRRTTDQDARVSSPVFRPPSSS